jgi:hypothetical protein
LRLCSFASLREIKVLYVSSGAKKTRSKWFKVTVGPVIPTAAIFIILLLQKTNLMDQQTPQQNQLNIEISEEVAEGTYANLAIITHSHAEFVIDFVNVMPGTPKSKVKSRIILTPQHAKRFMKAMTENIGKYEAVNGPIKDLEEIQLPMNFGGPTAQA